MTKSDTLRTRRKVPSSFAFYFKSANKVGWPFFLRQRARALLAFFHDEFVQLRIDGQGIIPGKTSETKKLAGRPVACTIPSSRDSRDYRP